MSRFEQIFVLTVVVGLLLTPNLARLFGVHAEAFENRTLAEAPEWNLRHALDERTYDRLATYLDETLPLRREAVDRNAELAVDVFHDSPTPRAHLGEGHWLYFDDALREACQDDTPIEDLLGSLRELSGIVRASGRRFLFVLVPNKYTVHPEGATHRVREIARCGVEKKRRLDEALARRPVEGLRDLTPELRELHERTHQLTFFVDDSHLDGLGSSVLARTIVDFVRPGFWDQDALLGPRPVRRKGDLCRMVRVRAPVMSRWYGVRRPAVKALPVELEDRTEGHPLRVYRSTSSSSELLDDRVFLLHDSSMNIARGMLRYYFEEFTTLDWNSFDPQDVADQMKAAEVVVVELVERGFYHRTHEQIGSREFLDILRRTLGVD